MKIAPARPAGRHDAIGDAANDRLVRPSHPVPACRPRGLVPGAGLTFTLATAQARQGGFSVIDPPAPPPLPDPPLVARFLLENPWPLSLVLLAAAAAVFAAYRHTHRRRAAAGAGALVVLAAGVFLLAAEVTTDRERLAERTAALVTAVGRADADAVDVLLAPEARLDRPGGGGMDRAEILSRVNTDLGGPWRLRDWSVLEVQAATTDNAGRTLVHVRVTPEVTGLPNLSWWRLEWRQTPSGWRVVAIAPASLTRDVEQEIR